MVFSAFFEFTCDGKKISNQQKIKIDKVLIFLLFSFLLPLESSAELRKKMVYYAMPLIMKSENGASTQQLCLNPNQVVVSESNNYNGQMSAPQPQQAQLINLSNGEMNGASPSQQNNYTYQLLTSNEHQQQPQPQSGHSSATNQRGPKQIKSFKCEHCSMTFTTKSAHTSHIKSHPKRDTSPNSVNTSNINGSQQMQSSDPYQCDVCKKTFAVPARLVSLTEHFKSRKKKI